MSLGLPGTTAAIVTLGIFFKGIFLTQQNYLHLLGPCAWGAGVDEHGYRLDLQQGGETTNHKGM